MFDVEYEVNSIVEKAINFGASDIHIEPCKDYLLVKFRIDGLLQEYRRLERVYQNQIINRIKIISHMDIGEQRIPQDGRWYFKLKETSLRISSMPTIYGEKIVIRILGNNNVFSSLEALGMNNNVQKALRRILARSYGLILVTGPTGSGKSSTLYTVLQEMNNRYEQIISLENPVEHELQGITQVEINAKAGLTFASGLRAALRQDPDIIMVGEIRDQETARLAIQAAMTGHKVLSTLHTNNACGVIERLVDMGIEPFLIKASLIGVIAQRLVRRPCLECNGNENISCKSCRGIGYKGRIALYEMLEIPAKNANWAEIEQYVCPSLSEAGREALEKNLTTIPELKRVGIWEVKESHV